jgi:hypothetical protein
LVDEIEMPRRGVSAKMRFFWEMRIYLVVERRHTAY